MGKVVAVILMLLAVPFILLGTLLGFMWEHVSMGWYGGRASSDWLGDRASEIRKSVARRAD